MPRQTESERLWGALAAIGANEPADPDAVTKLVTLGFVELDNDRPFLTARGRRAFLFLESGNGEVPELDNPLPFGGNGERVMDHDLATMTRDELNAEVQRLRDGIRQHRDATGQELCWHHPALWGLLPEKSDPVPAVPEWPQFLQGCIRYRQSLDEQAPSAQRTSEPYVQ